MSSPLQTLLLDNGLLDQPILLIEPHRSRQGIWRIKFSYDDFEPLSMEVQQASRLVESLHGIGENDLADEIDEAVGRAAHYKQCTPSDRMPYEAKTYRRDLFYQPGGKRHG